MSSSLDATRAATDLDAGASQMSSEALESVAAQISKAYLAAYERRRTKSKTRGAFPAAEPNALVGLAVVRGVRGAQDRRQAGSALAAQTHQALEQRSGHSAAGDIAGTAWAEGYGIVPMAGPPLEQIEWTLERGSASGAVRGPVAAAWRACFLATSWPLLGWERRDQALKELNSRLDVLPSRIDTFASELSPPTVSLGARLAFPAADAAARAGAVALGAAAARLLDALADHLDVRTGSVGAGGEVTSTGIICQVAAAARVAGQTDRADHLIRALLDRRHHRQRHLLLADEGSDERFELSPWVVLALPVPPSPAADAGPGHLRSLLRSSGWRRG